MVACPIIRESDGLAMSSRNVKLNERGRKLAPFIYATLKQAVEKKKDIVFNRIFIYEYISFFL